MDEGLILDIEHGAQGPHPPRWGTFPNGEG
jgi:hypothetical protein